MSIRIAYMTGEYLRISPFMFIYREVDGLRRLGVHVETISIRGLKDASEAVNAEQRSEMAQTYCLLPVSPSRLVAAHLRLLARAPGRYVSALRLAWSIRPPGLKAFLRQLAYFFEAGLVAARMHERELTHLHNHFASSSGTVAMLAAELGGFTFSLTEHGPAIFFAPYWWRIDEKFKRAQFVCCISHFCRSQIMIYTPPERWNRLHIIHCAVNPAEFSPIQHSGRGSRLLFTGRIAAVKGLPVLFEAVAKLKERWPDLILSLAGDGPDRAFLADMARDLGIESQVRFLGYQSAEQVRALLRETDVFVMSSFAEGVPVVLMEAMATGVPVIATRIAGVGELVEEGVSGFLTPPGDPGSLANRLETVLSDGELRARFGRAGREKVEGDFNIEIEASKLRDVFI
ncbi:MAG: glycosyltransferase family 4 protein, partial [Candidatus Hydrogenedentes bacterium]|nr:glycosyltransferase family 4 protein [Candidatus Hydrogenedentota bacterium]